MNYQKTYMNHIHSSSLLCQLAVMWKSQTLCDAIIRTGNITTKAHRVVLVAACPMLQSMENAAAGSHLEVRLAADIKQDSINSFLQYLYEGFITLTEENCKDVEKIARLLQVENVIKCCADFSKCLNSSSATQYKYTFSDQLEFRHMRTTDLSKVQERMHKRHLDTFRPSSPGSKRQRIIRPSSPHSDVSMHGATHKLHDTTSMAESYMSGAPDPMDRVPRLGSGIHPSSATAPTPSRSTSTTSLQPGVVNIVEDCIELIQTEPPGKHPGDGHPPEPRKVQSSVSISVASQHNAKTDLQIVNVTGTNESSDKTSAASDVIPISIPGSPSSSSSSSFKESSNIAHERHAAMNTSQQTSSQQKSDVDRGTINLTDVPFTSESDLMSGVKPRGADNFATSTPQRAPFPVSMSAVPRGQSQMFQSKQVPFAAGSATQAETGRGQRSQSLGSTGRSDPIERSSPAATTVTQVKDTSVKTKTESSSDMTPDISIVKVEGVNEGNSDYPGGLDMFVSEAGVTSQPRLGGDDDDPSDFELEEPPGDMSREEQMANEGGNFTGDQSGNWYMGSFRGRATRRLFCVICQGIFNTSPELAAHEERCTSSNVCYACSFCYLTYSDRDVRNQHVKTCHMVSSDVAQCEDCGKAFKSRSGYVTHRRVYHSQEELPKCPVCGKCFPSISRLAIHQRCHTEDKSFFCAECNRSYKHKKSLQTHRCQTEGDGLQ